MIDWWRLQSLFQKNPFFSDCHYNESTGFCSFHDRTRFIDLVQSQLLLDNVEYRERHLIACEENYLCSRVHFPNIYRLSSERNSEK